MNKRIKAEKSLNDLIQRGYFDSHYFKVDKFIDCQGVEREFISFKMSTAVAAGQLKRINSKLNQIVELYMSNPEGITEKTLVLIKDLNRLVTAYNAHSTNTVTI